MENYCKLWTTLQGQVCSMLIGELARKSGLSIDTIRFYEKQGLIGSELIQRRNNNYRDYAEISLERLLLIQQAKRLGFTLVEIREWINDFESDRLTVDQKRRILGQKLAQLDQRINELRRIKDYLSAKLDRL